MPWPHLLLGVAVVTVWGSNFVVIKQALHTLPPLAFAVLRFAFALFPAVLFIRRPEVPWRSLAAYGVLIGAGQFGLLYVAMREHISPGMASLVIQTQVFFTIALAALVEGERIRGHQWIALVPALAGLAIIAAFTDGSVSATGLVLVLLAALSWSAGNAVARHGSRVNVLGYVVWSSLFAVPPLAVLSLVLEGWPAVRSAVAAADAGTWLAVLWQAAGNTLFGYAVWAWLLARHPAATVAPLALGVPVVGMSASALWLGETLPAWKLAAAALLVAALAINLLWPAIRGRLASSSR